MILTYNLTRQNGLDLLQLAAIRFHQKLRPVAASEYGFPLASLAGFSFPSQKAPETENPPSEPCADGQTDFSDPMLVFCGMSQKDVSDLLDEMRRLKMPSIPLKAVLTPTNAGWPSWYLHRQLQEEYRWHQTR